MTKYIAFLRAINVSGHTVKMDKLKDIFSSIGFANVETFIASGNVIFESAEKSTKKLETDIEKKLLAALGFEVATFIRTPADVAAIANNQPFPQKEFDSSTAFNVLFLAERLDKESTQKVLALENEIDAFYVQGREVYWLCRRKQSESKFSNAVLERTLKRSSTMRGMSTLQKLAAKYK
jgi:uncharacterized protein (DUF1697 family)